VELVTEYAKDMCYEGHDNILADQLYMFAKQRRRLMRLLPHNLSYIITDSPLLLALIYDKRPSREKEALILKEFKTFENLNINLRRIKPYAQYGRGQTFEEALALDVQIREMLQRHAIPHTFVTADEHAPMEIYRKILTMEV
jgi:hypothetical protein